MNDVVRRGPAGCIQEVTVRRLAILAFGWAFCTLACAQFGEAFVDVYDPSTGLYLKSVMDKPRRDGVITGKSPGPVALNVNIFDPATGTSVALFKQAAPGPIALVLFETQFEAGSIEFHPPPPSGHILNNAGVEARAPKDRLLIGLRDAKGAIASLWTSDKRGNGLAQVAAVPEDASWHLDVRNSKIRVVRQVGQTIEIESYDW
jgi:hypothetical protein